MILNRIRQIDLYFRSAGQNPWGYTIPEKDFILAAQEVVSMMEYTSTPVSVKVLVDAKYFLLNVPGADRAVSVSYTKYDGLTQPFWTINLTEER